VQVTEEGSNIFKELILIVSTRLLNVEEDYKRERVSRILGICSQ
jgi:hypothetical protein